jgi:hypothetical protein
MDSNNHETPQIAEGFRVFFAPFEKSRTGYAGLRPRLRRPKARQIGRYQASA